MRTELFHTRRQRRAMLVAAVLAAPVLAAPAPVSAEGLFDFFFGGLQQQRPQRDVPQPANAFVDPFASQQTQGQPQYVPPTRTAAAGGSGPAFCVRSCDGKYFPSQLRTQKAGPEPPAAAERVGGTNCGWAAGFC